MFRQKRQPGRVCPVLPPAVQPGRCRRENNRPRQAPALLERPEPKRSAGRPAGCRRLFPQDRRAVEGRFLCEERYGCYRSKLDAIFARRKEYVRASSGTCRFDFTPRLDKSFSRGFTHYFLQGRDREISSFDTPKSLGEEMGTMKEQRGNYLTVAGVKPFHNGDGVCFLDEQGVCKVSVLIGGWQQAVSGGRCAPYQTAHPSFPQFRPGI